MPKDQRGRQGDRQHDVNRGERQDDRREERHEDSEDTERQLPSLKFRPRKQSARSVATPGALHRELEISAAGPGSPA